VSEVRVRAGRPGDEATVAALAAALNAEEENPGVGRFTPATVARDFLGEHPAGLLLVAEAPDGTLIGYATAHMTYETHHAERGLYVGDLYVAPAHRRRGVGRALMAAAAAAGRARGAAHLWWTARPGNAAAQAFYRRLGGRGETVLAFACVEDRFRRLAAEGAAGR
jgi:ribosomal protein S18 acetylase RimI-like enzyme